MIWHPAGLLFNDIHTMDHFLPRICRFIIAVLVLPILVVATEAKADNFWQSLGGPTGGSIGAVARDSVNDVLYVGTGYQFGYNKNAGSIFKSIDHGASWTYISAPLFTQMNAINTRMRALAVNTAGHLYAGLEGGGVVGTSNGGTNWATFNTGLGDMNVRALLFTPTGEFYAGTNTSGVYIFNFVTNTWSAVNTGLTSLDTRALLARTGYMLAASQTGGVFKRIGNGSWSAASNGLTTLRVNGLYTSPFTNIIFATTDSAVFSSVDDAASWQPVVGPFTGTLCWSVIDTGTSLLIGSNLGVYRSTDGGTQWSPANNGFTGQSARVLLDDGSGRVLVGSFDDGLFRSTDDGQNWTTANNGVYGHAVVRLLVSSKGYIQAGTNANGIYRSTLAGDPWEPVRLAGWHMFALAESPWGDIYAGNYNITGGQPDGHAWRSNDDGNTWTPLDNGISVSMVSGFVFPGSQQVICSTAWGMNSIRTSQTSGDLWTPLAPGPGAESYCLARNSQGDLFTGSEGHGVQRFSAANQTWTNLGLSASQQFSIVINSQGHVFVGNDGNIKGVYKSTNNGDGLAPLNSFPSNYGYVICILPNDDIYVGTREAGIQYSHDGGQTWATVNSGIPVSCCQSLTLGPDGHLYAGVAGFGVYRSVTPVVSSIAGDIDGDGDVDDVDVSLFSAVLVGSDTTPIRRLRSDLNSDGSNNANDIAPFVTAYLTGS